MTDIVPLQLKAPGEWGKLELDLCKVVIQSIPPSQFFDDPEPSLEHLDLAVRTTPLSELPLAYTSNKYLSHLNLAMKGAGGLLQDFSRETLELLDYQDEDGIMLCTTFPIPMTIGGGGGDPNQTSEINVFLLHLSHSLVLFALVISKEPAQVVATAIAVFQHNNHQRQKMGPSELKRMTIPCVSMSEGRRPTFYLVPVAQGLNDAVVTGRMPSEETKVLKCATSSTAEEDTEDGVGMEDPVYRQIALKHFLAFRTVAKAHWSEILEDIQAD